MPKRATGSESGRLTEASPPSVLPVAPPPAPPPPWPGPVAPGAGAPGDAAEPPLRTVGDAGTWLLIAAAGFAGGQILSSVILVAIASANGHLSNLSALAAQTVPPAWVVVGGLVGLWIGFVGAVFMASRFRGTRSVVADMGLR